MSMWSYCMSSAIVKAKGGGAMHVLRDAVMYQSPKSFFVHNRFFACTELWPNLFMLLNCTGRRIVPANETLVRSNCKVLKSVDTKVHSTVCSHILLPSFLPLNVSDPPLSRVPHAIMETQQARKHNIPSLNVPLSWSHLKKRQREKY